MSEKGKGIMRVQEAKPITQKLKFTNLGFNSSVDSFYTTNR